MPLTLTWATALVLIADGMLLGIGWTIAYGLLSWIGGIIAARRVP